MAHNILDKDLKALSDEEIEKIVGGANSEFTGDPRLLPVTYQCDDCKVRYVDDLYHGDCPHCSNVGWVLHIGDMDDGDYRYNQKNFKK